ncbi:MAG: outer membrane beta-barrel protein [Caulobacter sp.]|jgi:hypothetical protein|nr:outer membrane beta-barrel protein [Caulobacter sp.]
MKLRMFATAAVVAAAAAISAPAFAQDATGSVGVSASTTNIDVGGGDGDFQTYGIDGSVALQASENWTVTLGGNIATTDGDIGDDTGFGASAALTYSGSDWRVGPTVGYTDNGDDGQWFVGGVAQKYLDNVTLTGAVNYANIDDVDADVWTIGGDVRYFVSDNFRINGGLSYITVDAGGGDANAWNVGLGGEYQFANTGWSVAGGWDHSTSDDIDFDADTFKIGVRYSFGGSLKERDRSGADLGGAGLGALGVLF